MTQIAVVIVNHNTREHLRQCLASLLLESPSEIVVVDNASTDGSVEMVRSEFPGVKLQDNSRNFGYGAAANQGMAGCTAEYVLLLNGDTHVSAGTLDALADYLDNNPAAAIAGPRLVNPDGTLQRSCFPFPGTLKWFLHFDMLGQLIRRIPILRNYQWRMWPHTRAQIVPWVMGAALAIRRQSFISAGGFDESYFMYSEETDLCYRLNAAGWQVHFAPVTTVVHVGQASTNQYRAEMAVEHVSSKLLFYRRHYSTLRFAVLALMMVGSILARLVLDIIRLSITRDGARSEGIAKDITAWQRLLLGKWRMKAIRSST